MMVSFVKHETTKTIHIAYIQDTIIALCGFIPIVDSIKNFKEGSEEADNFILEQRNNGEKFCTNCLISYRTHLNKLQKNKLSVSKGKPTDSNLIQKAKDKIVEKQDKIEVLNFEIEMLEDEINEINNIIETLKECVSE